METNSFASFNKATVTETIFTKFTSATQLFVYNSSNKFHGNETRVSRQYPLSLIHTQTHANTPFLSPTHERERQYSLSLPSHARTPTLSSPLSLSHTHAPILSLSLTHTHGETDGHGLHIRKRCLLRKEPQIVNSRSGPFRYPNSSSGSQETPRILWYLKVRCRVR
jgi:hypothetical protein